MDKAEIAAQRAEDLGLMLAASRDDELAFATLYERYHGRVHQFIFGLTRDRSAASDLSQETFLRIWKFRHRYAQTGSFLSYLFGFARNVWLEHCRARKKQFSLELRDSTPRELNRFMGSALCDPDVAANNSEIHAHIFDALALLPDEQRMVFVLRSVEGLSFEEVASVMQCPLNTVRSRQITALKKLRRTLTRVYGSEGLLL